MNLKFRVFLIFLLSLPAMSVMADVVRLAPGHPEEYVVRKGDTLWDISGRFLEKPWRWPEVWKINPQIDNPHLIYPGDKIHLVYDEGQPYLELERGAGRGTDTDSSQADYSPPPREHHAVRPADRYLKLSPRVRTHSNVGAIKVLPFKILRPFLKELLVVEKDEMEDWPYVMAMGERGGRIVGADLDRVYLRGDFPEEQRRFLVYREGPAIHRAPESDGEQGELLGYRADFVGTLEVVERGDPSVAVIVDSSQEMKIGDRVRVARYGYSADASAEESMDFVPHSPEQEVNGHIVDVLNGLRHIGQFHVVILDVGRDAGLDPGSVVSIYQAYGAKNRDPIASERLAREHRAKPLSFADEDISPAANLLSKLANDLRSAKHRFDDTTLGRHLGAGPPEEEVIVQLPSGYLGNAMIFRSFPNLSYALVMDWAYPPVLYDKVGNPR